MKLLCASSDLQELTWLVKRLVHSGIPCGVCRDSSNSHLSVWIQQDGDFPLALRIFARRDRPRRLPHWAELLDAPVPATKQSALPATKDAAAGAAGGSDPPRGVGFPSKGPARTGAAGATTLWCTPEQRRPDGAA